MKCVCFAQSILETPELSRVHPLILARSIYSDVIVTCFQFCLCDESNNLPFYSICPLYANEPVVNVFPAIFFLDDFSSLGDSETDTGLEAC